MDEKQMLNIVEGYSRLGNDYPGEYKIIPVPNWQSVIVETIGEIGRSIVLTEYKVDGKTFWAGFSTRSQTIFVSSR